EARSTLVGGDGYVYPREDQRTDRQDLGRSFQGWGCIGLAVGRRTEGAEAATACSRSSHLGNFIGYGPEQRCAYLPFPVTHHHAFELAYFHHQLNAVVAGACGRVDVLSPVELVVAVVIDVDDAAGGEAQEVELVACSLSRF